MSANNDKCYCCPYGGLLSIPATLAGFAMIFIWGSAATCSFFRIESPELFTAIGVSEDLTLFRESDYEPKSIGVGFWNVQNIEFVGDTTTLPSNASVYELGEECIEYPESLHVDGVMKFARVMGVLVGLFAFVAFVCILLGSCIELEAIYFRQTMATCFFVISILPLFFLIALRSDICQDAESCKLSGGGTLAIITTFLWLAAGVTTLIIVKPRPLSPITAPVSVAPASPPPVPEAPPVIRERVVVTQKPDGTTTTTTEVTELRGDGTTQVRQAETTETEPAFSLT